VCTHVREINEKILKTLRICYLTKWVADSIPTLSEIHFEKQVSFCALCYTPDVVRDVSLQTDF
jgi:hypothetical protein